MAGWLKKNIYFHLFFSYEFWWLVGWKKIYIFIYFFRTNFDGWLVEKKYIFSFIFFVRILMAGWLKKNIYFHLFFSYEFWWLVGWKKIYIFIYFFRTNCCVCCYARTHFCQQFQHLLSERLTSLGIMGAPRVPPLNPSETIVLSKLAIYLQTVSRLHGKTTAIRRIAVRDGSPVEGPLKPLWSSQHYCIVRFKGGS